MQLDQLRRREFITLLGGGAAWPLAARAQQAMPVIGYLEAGSLETTRENVAAVRRGLSDTGYVEGRNLGIEYRWAEDHLERLPALADDLVRRQVAAIVVTTTPAVLAAKAATKSISIVFSMGADPVETGLVASLNRPGGNLTGIYNLNTTVGSKRLELLHELVPTATSIAFLVNPTNAVLAETQTRELQVAARTLGVRLLVLSANDPSEFDAGFATLVVERVGGLLVSSDALFSNRLDQLIALAVRHRLPTMYARRDATVAGGLMSYGPDYFAALHQVGVYAGRILKGDKPADLPVQQATKFELIINLKTAKALGLTMPLPLLGRADEVIE
jgi:putative tryptophan/tyrosine transport system substrate-binding protein